MKELGPGWNGCQNSIWNIIIALNHPYVENFQSEHLDKLNSLEQRYNLHQNQELFFAETLKSTSEERSDLITQESSLYKNIASAETEFQIIQTNLEQLGVGITSLQNEIKKEDLFIKGIIALLDCYEESLDTGLIISNSLLLDNFDF